MTTLTTNKVTHEELVQIAAIWLRKKNKIMGLNTPCTVVMTNMLALDTFSTSEGEQPDAIGWCSHYSTLIECKISRHDFFDNRLKPHKGVGRFRYFLVPENMVKPSEVPETWGLLYWNGAKVSVALEAPDRLIYDTRHEVSLLLAALRRIRPNPEGITTVYNRENKRTATLGIEFDAFCSTS